MMRILADQNFDGPTLRGLQRRIADLEVVRTEDIGLKRFQDEKLLGWAASENRVIVTHDARTFIDFAYERMSKGLPFCGVIVVPDTLSRRQAIDDLMLLILGATDNELYNSVIRLPL